MKRVKEIISRVSRNDVNLQLVITAPTYPTQGVPFTSHIALLGAVRLANQSFNKQLAGFMKLSLDER